MSRGRKQRERASVVGAASAPCLVALLAVGVWWGAGFRAGHAQSGAADVLTANDVRAVITTAAEALGDDTMAVAVTDRVGTILGVYARPDTAPETADIAVSLARTGAFFSNDQAPLSSRTVRFISSVHFPPGVRNTPNGALYGIEQTNRGCRVDGFHPTSGLAPSRSLAGTFGTGPGTLPLPCEPSDTRGCAAGGPLADLDGSVIRSVGITTGKADLLDAAAPLDVPVDPGGVPLFRDGRVVGGVGVAGVAPDRAEYAAAQAATGAGAGLGFPSRLPAPGAVFIEGLQLPFFGRCSVPIVACVGRALRQRPAGSSRGSFFDGVFIVAPRSGVPAPEGYLVGPRGSRAAGGLTRGDVEQIVDRAIASAGLTRAQIRLPAGETTRMVIAVADAAGEVLAAYRMPDATWFSVDVSIAKSRNAYYFSSRAGYEVLRRFVEDNPYAAYRWEPEPPGGQGWAVTNRTLSFGGQPIFPPGIDLEHGPTPGPWFDLFRYDARHPCTEGPGPRRGGDRTYGNQSGIVWFPGSAPLYKDGRLAGGLGVSGDGVEQDDLVSAVASSGFEPPGELRVDRSVISLADGNAVRLPYFQFPRNPTQR